jgi:predicted RNA binding protein YcfA (HicA-like mRNA interferase family)
VENVRETWAAERDLPAVSNSDPLKVSVIIKLISNDGWYLDRQRGSHRQYKHSRKRGLVTVPGKPSDDLHPKTRDSILRQAGLKEDGTMADDV